MSQIDRYTFELKEMAEILLRHNNIHEGHWGIYVEFGLGAANIGVSPDGERVLPAAIIPIQKLGIQRFDQPNPLTVDAAVINPVKPPSPPGATRKVRIRGKSQRKEE